MIYLLELVWRDRIRAAGLVGELLTKQVQGIPPQRSDIPTEKVLDGRFELPDICKAADGFRFVSDRGRAALEELAPNCVAFFPLKLKVPRRMRPANAYFFFDVLPRAQLIDWDQSPTVPRVLRAADGRESRALKAGITDPSVSFKPVTVDTPPIWREADVDRPTVHFFNNKLNVLMQGNVWNSLNTRFPDQLVARKLA